MGTKRWFQTMTALAALLMLANVISAGQSFAAEAPATIKLGAAVALTGAMAAGGKDVKAGYEIAVKHINDAAGFSSRSTTKSSLSS